MHNSGHKAYFNSRAAQLHGLNRDTPDPKGAKYGRDADGELDGTAEETGAVFPLLGGVIDFADYPRMLLAECARLNRAGLTTCSEMAFDPGFRPLVEGLRSQLTVRLRTYEISNPQMSTDATPGQGDDILRQVGIKIWVDGSPWIGNIDLSFPYLDTEATRIIGVAPGSCGCANYTKEQLHEIVGAYFPLGWPMACHVQGDAGVDTILDVYEDVLRRHPRDDHRLRLEHVGAIRPEQLRRAHELGVTCSIFVDQIHYWGDVIVDRLFGEERGTRWMPAGSAVATGMRISLHNDPPVTPEEPLRNISVAVTRTAPSGRVLGPEERLTVEQAIRAQTIDAAWQLFSDDVIGSLEVGKYADLVVLSADPRTVSPSRSPTSTCGRPIWRAARSTARDAAPRGPAGPPARGGAAHAGAVPRHHHPRGRADRGPGRLGEFGAFVEYQPPEAAHWLACGIEAAYRQPPPVRRDRIPINATVPAVPAAQVGEVLARFPGAGTAKVKVAEPGQTLADDVARVNAVRDLVPTVRVDANGGWRVEQAVEAAAALTADGPLEYLEQPCATVGELAELRRRVDVPIAADESIRKAEDPLAVVRAGRPTSRCSKSPRWAGFRPCSPSPTRSTSPSWSPARWTRRSGSAPG